MATKTAVQTSTVTLVESEDSYRLESTTLAGERIAARMFFLAWQACDGPVGMGSIQDRDDVDEAKVWANVKGSGDYAFNHHNNPRQPYGDYVFGRMMKFGCEVSARGILLRGRTLRSDYQSWCHAYPTVKDLAQAVVASLNNTTK